MVYLLISAVLLSISTPLSIALDEISIAVGFIGLVAIFKKIRLNGLDYRVLGVSFVGILSSLLSVRPFYSIRHSHYLWHFLPYFIASNIKKEHIKNLIFILGIFGVVSSLGVIFQAFTGINPKDVAQFNNIHLLHYPIRAKGFFSVELTTACILSVISLIFSALFFFYNKKSVKLFSLFVFIFVFIGLILTLTRSYWLGFFAAILLLPFINIAQKNFRIVSVSFLVLFAVLFLFVKPIHKRVESIVHFKKDVSAMDRIVMWEAAIDMYKNYSIKNKLLGCGSANVFYFSKPYQIKHIRMVFGDKHISRYIHYAIHNVYLQILLKWGIIGLLIWLNLWIYVLWLNIKFILKSEDGFEKAFIIGVTLGFISFLVGGFFENNLGDAEVIMFIMYLLGLNKKILEIGVKI